MTQELLLKKIGMSEEAKASMARFVISEKEYAFARALFYRDEEAFYAYLQDKTGEKFTLALLCYFTRFAVDLYEEYKAKGYSDEIYFDTFSDLSVWQKNYLAETGKIGVSETCWLTSHMHGGIVKLGSLQFQEDVLDEDIVCGQGIVREGTTIYFIHVQQGVSLSPKEVERSFALAKKYLGEKLIFLLHSWLADPTLASLLSENSNILAFQRQFEIYGKEQSDSIERYVFGRKREDKNAYQPTTSFAYAVKEALLQGRTFYEGHAIKFL